jgi:Flp pilus assembly protein protease CpaA
MITAVIGGLLGLIIIIKKRFILEDSLQSSENVNFPVSKKKKEKIPYGIAIACGGFFIAWELKLKILTGLNI